MSRLAWCVWLVAIGACAATDDEPSPPLEPWDDPTVVDHAACSNALVTIDPAAPIFFYYGAYRATGAPAPRVDSAPTLAIDPPGEKVLMLRRPGVPCVGTVAELQPWLARGGMIAHVMSIEELEAALDTGDAADRIEAMLRAGYAYVGVDEIGHSSTGWRQGGARVAQLRQLLQTLASRGLDRRLIVYVNSYNMAGILHLYADTFALLRDHARIVGYEVYLHTANVFSPGAEPAGHCTHSVDCFEQIAAEMSAAAPGINHRAATVIATSDEYTGGSPAELCRAPGGGAGALTRQLAAIHAGDHTRLQPGLGAYTLGRIERVNHPAWGPADHVACMNHLEHWWATHALRMTR